MNRNKLLWILVILIALSIVGACVFYWFQPTEEVREEKPSVTREIDTVAPTKSPQKTTESNHNATMLEKQLTTFIPLFYNASYAENSEDKVEDYVTVDFYNEMQQNKDNHVEYEDKDYSIRISGLSFYIPIKTQIENETSVKVLTSFATSIRSSGAPEVDRSILVELTMTYSDTWRVSHIEDKSSLSQGGE
ncbi:hypothetical protein LSA88_002821 [Listeria monocytogenes]|nr:hypothetical protein [Listeria monocytogenes]EIP2458376.1 hypothetical protein [Listeria monocytogenes]EIP2514733.1 hypothetical protein [Listeria monocytogenes]EIR6790375.1 hypothetical protein [Listeria monocytogenes]EIR6803626.1 hypothetical protein [Listeria monocytogenes]